MLHFLDTSAILNGGLNIYENVYISPIVIQELEKIKSSNKPEEIKAGARKAIKKILNNDYHTELVSQKKINKLLKKYDFLMNINDHRMICEALLLSKKEKIHFITSDMTQLLFTRATAIVKNYPYFSSEMLYKKSDEKVEYTGWKITYPSEEELISLYTHPEINILNLKTNEFAEIFENKELKDILFWDGKKYTNLKYKNIKNPYTEEIIKPRNLEQKLAFHLLQNTDIKVKLLTSAWGSGKTMLALNYALEQISKGTYEKLVFVRNNIIAAGTNDIGYLPGTVREKLAIFARCIADHVGGEEELEHLMDEGIIETIPLSHIRGRSIKNSIVLCDECENMDDKLTTLLLSRIESSSEIIFCGDIAQIDKKIFSEHNGIKSMLDNLAGDPLFGTVKLIKSERGPVAALCDKMIPPK